MSVKDTDKIQVQNLTAHRVGFSDEDTHRRFIFQGYEKKTIPAEILRRLNYSRGGAVLLREYLSVKNDELAREFGVDVEDIVEYNWTAEDVDRVLTTGTVDELLDALDFGPEGIKDLILERGRAIGVTDVNKVKAIKEKTGCDLSHVAEIEEALDEKQEKKEPAKRRSSSSSTTTKRRTSTSKSTTAKSSSAKTQEKDAE